tara:strand:- start:9897 stop:11102 length:1206 start_codon:yes stop_codon:yes gene_type:complete
MAINVNTVYTTVLSILNKEQRGYITPDEFNKIATQVQLEIFEGYFEDLNQQLRVPQSNTEYINRQLNLDTALAIFKTSGPTTVVPVGSVTRATVTNAGSGYVSETSATTTAGSGTGLTIDVTPENPTFTLTGGTGYSVGINIATTVAPAGGSGLTVDINEVDSTGKITALSINTPGLSYSSADVCSISGGDANASIALTSASNGAIGAISINNSGQDYAIGEVVTLSAGGGNATATINTVNDQLYFLPPSFTHRIGTVIYKDSIEAQRVDKNELLYLNLSPLTQPSETYPVYLYEKATAGTGGNNTGQSHIYMYPKSISTASDVTVSYIRKPEDVVWGFSVGTLGQYIYSSSSSTQFELSDVEQNEVILRILAYAGVIIKDPQIIQVASQAIQAEEQNSKN